VCKNQAAAAVGMTLHLNQRSRLEPRPIRFVVPISSLKLIPTWAGKTSTAALSAKQSSAQLPAVA